MEFDPSQPIWLQLVAEFGRRVVTAQWPTGSRIPGVRELALELGVNPNTVQRALAELERDGLFRTERTAGRFVTTDEAAIERLRLAQATASVDAYAARAAGLGLDLARATALLRERWPQQ